MVIMIINRRYDVTSINYTRSNTSESLMKFSISKAKRKIIFPESVIMQAGLHDDASKIIFRIGEGNGRIKSAFCLS